MGIYQNLETLESNLYNAKKSLATSLSDRGIESNAENETLTQLIGKIDDIQTGDEGGKFLCPERIFFSGSSATTEINLTKIDTSKVTYMGSMFYGCKGLTSLDLSSLDTSNVTSMSSMFGMCTSLTSLDLSSFDTSNVTSMSNMFSSCSNLTSLDLSNFDTSKVTSMESMFYNCNLTSLDLSNFDTSNVTNMYDMFYGCISLTSLDLSSWDTSKVTRMQGIFRGGITRKMKLEYLNICNFDTSNVTNMNNMFDYCIDLTDLIWNNLGNSSAMTELSLKSSTKLGINTDKYPNARQHLTDTFVKNSFDRASNGYSTCTITLHENTKAVLTEDEIAQITAKGFTIA